MPTDGGQAGAAPAAGPPAGGLPDRIGEQITLVDEATGQLLSALAGPGWAGVDPGRATLCPGWTAGHVLTHLARNADGLRRCAEGARRGEAVPMYDSAGARNRDIEAGAGRPLPELADDVTGSARALAEAWAAMSPADWPRPMGHPQAGSLPLHATPGLRLGEVLIHHVDLAGPYGPADWPAAFVAGLLADVPGELTGRLPDGIAAEVRATDTGAVWTAGSGAGTPVTVSGPSWAVAAWLTGRPAVARPALRTGRGELPELRPWR